MDFTKKAVIADLFKEDRVDYIKKEARVVLHKAECADRK